MNETNERVPMWTIPLVTVRADERVYEWWHARKKLTVYVTQESVEYVLVDGNGLTDGEITCETDIHRVCAWIMAEEAS